MSDDCPICKPTPIPVREEDGFSTPLRMPGTRHRDTCPTLPRLSADDEARLRADLAEMDRVRRRGAAEIHHIIFGGSS